MACTVGKRVSATKAGEAEVASQSALKYVEMAPESFS
jgi:hypothetical protein